MFRSRHPIQLWRLNKKPSSHRLFASSSRRAITSTPPPPPPTQSDRIQRILSRTPKFLRPTLSALQNAPITHITAFLILHELTAIIPLFSLVGAFHYFQWLPPYFAEGKWVLVGVEKFGNYFRKKGWIESGDKRQASELAEAGEATKVEKKGRFSKWRNNRERKEGRVSKWWGRGETGTRLVVEFATAYAVVKALVPLRLFLSVWGAPWFARWTVVPFSNMVKGWFRGSSKKVGTGAAAAGAGAGGTKGLNSEKITK